MSARLTLVETCGVRVVELTEVREQEGMRPLPPGPHVSQPVHGYCHGSAVLDRGGVTKQCGFAKLRLMRLF